MLCLNRANLLNDANFRHLAEEKFGDIDHCLISYLEELGIILTQEILDDLVGLRGDTGDLYTILNELEEQKIVNEVNLKDLLAKDSKVITEIADLTDCMDFTKEAFLSLLALKDFSSVEPGIELLSAAELATQENIEAFLRMLAADIDTTEFFMALQILHNRDLLDQEILNSLFVKRKADLEVISLGLQCLDHANILTPENLAAFLAGNPAMIHSISYGIQHLEHEGILSQEKFMDLLSFLTQEGTVAPLNSVDPLQDSQTCQDTFQVRLSDLQSNPVEVLQKWCNLPKPPETIQFLTDGDVPLPEDNASRLTAQFYAQLVENLFKEGVVFSSFHPKTGMPLNVNFDAHKETIKRIGVLIGYMYDRKLTFGQILPKEFFLIPAILKGPGDFLAKQRAIINALKTRTAFLLQAWLEHAGNFGEKYNDIRKRVCKLFSEIEENFDPQLSDKALREKAAQMIQRILSPYTKIAREFLSGLSSQGFHLGVPSRLYYDLQPYNALEISYDLQGTLDGDIVKSCVSATEHTL